MASLKQLLEERDRLGDRWRVFDLYQQVGMRLARRGQPAAARAMLSLAVHRLDGQFGSNHLQAQEALNILALHDYNLGDFASALLTFERLYASTLRTWGETDRLTRLARIRVWQCHRHLRPPVPAREP